jgi:hypothetical protein
MDKLLSKELMKVLEHEGSLSEIVVLDELVKLAQSHLKAYQCLILNYDIIIAETNPGKERVSNSLKMTGFTYDGKVLLSEKNYHGVVPNFEVEALLSVIRGIEKGYFTIH